jgi:hypothetical protein
MSDPKQIWDAFNAASGFLKPVLDRGMQIAQFPIMPIQS